MNEIKVGDSVMVKGFMVQSKGLDSSHEIDEVVYVNSFAYLRGTVEKIDKYQHPVTVAFGPDCRVSRQRFDPIELTK